MNVLALCSGVGGLELGLKQAVPPARVVCYVERDLCAAEVLVARMEDGSLAPAPIWSDLLTFPSGDFGGRVDLVAAGFPCQPVSVAGKRLRQADPRWLWPYVWQITRDVGARYLFVENVPGLLGWETFGEILGSLAAAGWDAEWDCVSAASVGAPHRRDRVFLLAANPDGARKPQPSGAESAVGGRVDHCRDAVANPGRSRLEERCLESVGNECVPIAGGSDWWRKNQAPEPTLCGMDDGATRQVDGDRLFCLGNAVVPQAAATAFARLWDRLMEQERPR